MSPFHIPLKIQKMSGVLMFPEDLEREHWSEMVFVRWNGRTSRAQSKNENFTKFAGKLQ